MWTACPPGPSRPRAPPMPLAAARATLATAPPDRVAETATRSPVSSVSIRDRVVAAAAAAGAAECGVDAGAAAAGPTARKDAVAVAAAIAMARRAGRSRPLAPEGLLAFIRFAPRFRAMARASISPPRYPAM